MKISEALSRKYFKGEDFRAPKVLVIESVQQENFNNRPKPVIRFRGEERRLVLNVTNSLSLSQAFGDETDAWQGRAIEVYSAPTTYQGKDVLGARVRPVLAEKQGPTDSNRLRAPQISYDE